MISFSRSSIQEWCLGIILLKLHLIQTLIISNEHKQKCLEIQIFEAPERSSKSKVILNSTSYWISISQTQVEYILSFFLKYYRDGIAEVDHVDLDAIDVENGNQEVGITITVPDFAPSMTPEELDRRLEEH